MKTWLNINGFSPNLVCALILSRSGLVLLMGKFCLILTELSARDMPIFSFLDDNLSKCQGILTKLSTCIDIKKVWFGIVNGQISSKFDRVICRKHDNGWYYSLTILLVYLLYWCCRVCKPRPSYASTICSDAVTYPNPGICRICIPNCSLWMICKNVLVFCLLSCIGILCKRQSVEMWLICGTTHVQHYIHRATVAIDIV